MMKRENVLFNRTLIDNFIAFKTEKYLSSAFPDLVSTHLQKCAGKFHGIRVTWQEKEEPEVSTQEET